MSGTNPNRKAKTVTTPNSDTTSTPTNSVPTSNEENIPMSTDTSDVTTTSTDATTPENTEPNMDPGNMDQNFYMALRDQLIGLVNDHNRLASEIQNAGDRVALKDQLLENPDQTNDSEFVANVKRMQELSDALAEIERIIDAAAEPFIQNALKRSGVVEKQEKADEIAKQAKATANYLSAMNASTDGIPNLVGRKSGATSTGDGRGAGVKKYRNLNVFVDGKRAEQKATVKNKDTGQSETVLKSNLTYGAQAANVPSDVFRAAFIKAQGTEDASNFKDKVEFDVTDGNNVTHSVVVLKDAE
jgi:hypothetical protein